MKPGTRVKCIAYPRKHVIGKYGTVQSHDRAYVTVCFDADYATTRHMLVEELEIVK